MRLHSGAYGKLAVRLVGLACGLGLALFLFSGVAFGHGYSGGGYGGNRMASYPMSYGMNFRNNNNNFRFRNNEFRNINIRFVVRFNVRSFDRCNNRSFY